MSNGLRKYINGQGHGDGRYSTEVDRLSATAFVGGENLGRAVQITLDKEYYRLSEAQARDLAVTLLRRIDADDQKVEATALGGDWGVMDIDGGLK